MSEHELWNELGNLYFLSGEYQQAVYAYKRSIQMDERFGKPYSNLALTYVQQGRYEQAIDLYRRSIELLAEDKERAISWNRLGNVFRHLKDYDQAVVAFRNADELDPENDEGEDKPGWLSAPAPASGRERAQTATVSTAVEGPFPYAGVTQEEASEEDPTATWAPMDPTLFQQDIFEALEPGTLTTWGDPNVDTEDPGANWPPGAETEILAPDVEDDDLSKWIPLPEEQPLDALEYSLEAVDLAAEVDEALEELDAAEEAEARDVFSDLKPEPPDPVPAAGEEEKPTAVAGLLPSPTQSQGVSEAPQRGNVTATELDVIVQERPETEFVMVVEPAQTAAIEMKAAEVEIEAKAEAEAVAEAVSETPPAAVEAAINSMAAIQETEAPASVETSVEPQRDADEIREIENGLAKYKRVVQLNPKNARAWDTLGNLYKAAGQYKEALLAYEKAIENDPTKALFHHHLGLVYACEGRMDDAINAFQQVIELEPEHALAHATLGGYYRKKGLEELAQKHVGIAMKSIFDSENEYNRACLAAICGNTDQALELLRVALKTKQTYVDWILRDPDLDFIRQDPRFKQLIADYAG